MEPRNPASTTLDLLLADALLGSRPSNGWGEVARLDVTSARPLPTLDDAATGRSVAPAGDQPSAGVTVSSPEARDPADRRRDERELPVFEQPVFRPPGLAAPTLVGFGDVPAVAAGTAFPPPVGMTDGPTPLNLVPPVGVGPMAARSGLAGPGGEEPDPAPAPAPSITVELSTAFVPVNANKTSGSPWKQVNGVDQVGLPTKRDFEVAPIPGGDPELKAVTVRVTNPHAKNTLHVGISSATAGQPGGWAGVYIDSAKTRPLSPLGGQGRMDTQPVPQAAGAGQFQWMESNIPAEFTFYLEGKEPSRQVQDVVLKVRYRGLDNPDVPAESNLVQKPFTVTPVLVEFSGNKDGDGKTMVVKAGADGSVVGIKSGLLGSTQRGAVFTADYNPRTNVNGRGRFLQNIESWTPKYGTTNTNRICTWYTSERWEWYSMSDGTVVPTLVPANTYPLIDSPTHDSIPFYLAEHNLENATRHRFDTSDSPGYYLPLSVPAGTVLVDTTSDFVARMYTVWEYEDETIYPFASVGWSVHFKLIMRADGSVTTDANSGTSVGETVRSHAEPAVITGPTYNELGRFTSQPQ